MSRAEFLRSVEGLPAPSADAPDHVTTCPQLGDITSLTKSQVAALRWLKERSGDGCFDNDGVLLAGGELAPFMRSTWNALRYAGMVEFYNPNPSGKGRGRVRVIQ